MNHYEIQNKDKKMKTLQEITMYDLMAEDLDIWISKNNEFGFNLEIDDESGEPIVAERSVHKCATDSLADFCRHFLYAYDKACANEAII